MFKVNAVRLAALVVVVTGAAFFISCQRNASGPTESVLSETDAYSVYGTCYDHFNQPTSNIICKVYCETHSQFIYTVDLSDPDYVCVPAPPDYATHNGDTAHAVGYDPWNQYWGKSSSFTIGQAGNNADIYQQ